VKIMPHDFRRSFITRVIEEHDLSIAQKLAHHSNIQTTANYDVRDDNERRRAVDRFDLDQFRPNTCAAPSTDSCTALPAGGAYTGAAHQNRTGRILSRG
jgi:hypothetical protein